MEPVDVRVSGGDGSTIGTVGGLGDPSHRPVSCSRSPCSSGSSRCLPGSRFAQPAATSPVLPATGIVDNVMAGYLAEGIAKARRRRPGGRRACSTRPAATSTRRRRSSPRSSRPAVPVIVWVAPSGARAASAGTFITLAAHVAVMAPGTNIGAASPVGGQGEDIPGTLGRQGPQRRGRQHHARSPRSRGRNVDWAGIDGPEARSSAASEALSVGAVDGIAATIEEVLEFANGANGRRSAARRRRDRHGRRRHQELAMNPLQAFLHLLSDPNIAFILFTLGFYGLLFELQIPNFVTGILGALAFDPRLHRLRQPAAQRGRAAARSVSRSCCSCWSSPSRAMACSPSAGSSASRWARPRSTPSPATPTAPTSRWHCRIIAAMTGLTAAFMAFVLWAVIRWRRRMGGR